MTPLYTRRDILILQKCLNQYITEQNRLSQIIEPDIDILNMIIKGYLSVKKPDLVWINNKLKQATSSTDMMDSKCHDMMYIMPLDVMPLYINENGWSAIAHWRLQIGR